MVGALRALRAHGVVPDIITGISAGSFAAYMAYSDLTREEVIEWFRLSRTHFRKRPIRRFLPPYDISGEGVQAISRPYLVDMKNLRDMGLKHFYVGYTGFPHRRFIVEDILRYSRSEDAYRTLMKSSTIPFVTHQAPHLDGAIDGTYSRAKFISPHEVDERWFLTIKSPRYPIEKEDWRVFTRIVALETCVINPLYSSDRRLKRAYEMGWEQIEALFGADLGQSSPQIPGSFWKEKA